jgi:hypothetical protein
MLAELQIEGEQLERGSREIENAAAMLLGGVSNALHFNSGNGGENMESEHMDNESEHSMHANAATESVIT